MSRQTLFLDLETYSDVPITNGTYAYAERAEVLLVAWAWGDEDVVVWDATAGAWEQVYASMLQAMLDRAEQIVVHAKSDFDPVVLRKRGLDVPQEKVLNTSILALQHSLPAGLDELCRVLDVPFDLAKDKAGKKLIQLFTKPQPKNRKVRRATRDTHPAEWEAFKTYAASDITAMREVLRRMPRWNDTPFERHIQMLDQRSNERGVRIDLELAEAALRAFDRTKKHLSAEGAEATGGAVRALTQRDRLLEFINQGLGFELPNLQKGTVRDLLDSDIDPVVREILELRQQAAAASPAKYKAALRTVSPDGRLRGMTQYCGASRTSRDAGRLVQLQNLPRPTLKPHEIETGIRAMKMDCEALIYDHR